MNYQQGPPQSLEDISTIDCCGEDQAKFEANQELQLLQGGSVRPVEAPPSERQLPQNTESGHSTNPHQKKPMVLQAETCWSSRGTFMADLERFTKEISFETEVFDIYAAGEESQQKMLSQCPSIPKVVTNKILMGRLRDKYVMDFSKPRVVVKKNVKENKGPLEKKKSVQPKTTSTIRSLDKAPSPETPHKQLSKLRLHLSRGSQCSIKSPTMASLRDHSKKLLSPRGTISQVSLVHKIFKPKQQATPATGSTLRSNKKRRS